MKLAFYIHDGRVLDRIIRLAEADIKDIFNGKWKTLPSHCEFVFSDGTFFSSSPRDGGTRFKKIEQNDRWIFIDFPITPEQEEAILAFCKREDGKRYDWFGLLWFICPIFIFNNRKRWFCSEVMVKGMHEVGILTDKIAEHTNPYDLLKLTK